MTSSTTTTTTSPDERAEAFRELMHAMRIDFSPTEEGRAMIAEWVAFIRSRNESTGKLAEFADYIERYLITEPLAVLGWYHENGIDPDTGEEVATARKGAMQ